jgi:ubiquinone/menaquinone biosynthesis C-methylase UbiE
MAEFHFVEDYERYVADLVEQHPIDEAMALAVGGLYEEIGTIERLILEYAGLEDGMMVIDLGCGSGRLAHALGAGCKVDYLGIDVVSALLAYAKTKAPPHYRFVLNRELSLPAADASADVVCGFSVFTHLLHAETYIYLAEMYRVLKPGGLVVFSFLEFGAGAHWTVFEQTVAHQRAKANPPLNTFIERSVIKVWCRHLGFELLECIDGDQPRWDGKLLGQSIAILRR